MKLSIITVCYNEKEVERTCKSVFSQSFQDFEWVFIDGGSSSRTLAILEKYKQRINSFVSESDNGIYSAMNKGINLATGEYLLFLNAGDTLNNSKVLEKAAKSLKNYDILFGDLEIIKNGKTAFKKYPRKLPYGWFITDTLAHPSTFIKKELFDKFGLYNENNKIVSDWVKWIEFIEINKCSYNHLPFVVSKFFDDGISSSEKYTHNKEREKFLKEFYGLDEIVLPEKKVIKILGIPVLKIVDKHWARVYYLFGIIPVIKIYNKDIHSTLQ